MVLPHDPFRQLANLGKEFDRFFSEFPARWENERNLGGIRVDVYETDNEVVATCDLPGLEKREDVELNIDNNILSISGSTKKTAEVKDENMYRKERYVGRFFRSIPLPVAVSTEGVKATYKNGVLEVRMPKLDKDNKKKIDIEFE
ncbi:Hsp20/alpha crystallin family protein [Bacillus kwashiorkori]|uniref:Hsp20/alpha crystallin family protein n=1 Tax=Bacillus kwashiorkori TaxID=1522318 RepID=UPI0007841D41|nr:Hsp20/alpha crystallin family protein [Bacillus kwashiorkori]